MAIKTFDEILAEILTDYENQIPDVDRSPGSVVYVKSVALASALWGLYRYADRVSKQIFPDTCDSDILDRHANARGIYRTSGETDSALLTRLLAHMRHPPAGGNKYDFERWALEVEYVHDEGLSSEWTETVKTAKCYPTARGVGTVNVAITSSRTEAQGGEEEPTTELVAAVQAYIDDLRPVGCPDFIAYAATKETVAITMVTGLDAATIDILEADIEGYVKGLAIGATLYRSQLLALAINRGAENPTLSTPAADVVPDSGPTSYEQVWSDLSDGDISIT